MENVESQIAEWRAYVANAPGVNGHEVDELEDHLRHQISEPERGRPHRRRGVPGRRKTVGGPRRPVPGVRTRAQRPVVEATRPER